MSSAEANSELSRPTAAHLGRPLWGHFFEGKVSASLDGATMPIIDPATEKPIGIAAKGSAADVDRAVESARAAYEDGRWRNLPPLEKEARLHRFADLVEQNSDTISDIDALNAGLLRWFAAAYTKAAIDVVRYYAGWPSKINGLVPPVPAEQHAILLREPVGVVGIIFPWNGPVYVLEPLAAALATGNSVVVKPAELTPMTAIVLAELAVEAGIPPGVFNVIQGEGSVVGPPLVESDEINVVSFTGSVPTGMAIQAAAAKGVKPVILELGGKSPSIIFSDADLDTAAQWAAMGVWLGSGQICIAGTRVLVHRDVHDAVVKRIIANTQDMVIGPGLNPGSQIGPLISAKQLARVERYVEIGRSEGAKLAYGGKRRGDVGFFFEPTVFTSVRNHMRIAQEEVFGPVMCVMPFESEEEAFALANDIPYGLAAAVWTRDLGRAHRAIRALNAGSVWVNSYMTGYPSVPNGGFKRSGHGKLSGEAALYHFTRIKSAWITVN
jgi:acyl-CoA reductase-like NAD-dependent aldehyde dehydrogenase